MTYRLTTSSWAKNVGSITGCPGRPALLLIGGGIVTATRKRA